MSICFFGLESTFGEIPWQRFHGEFKYIHIQKTTKMKEDKNELEVNRSYLMTLFETSLKDIYWAERALTGILSKMATKASSRELIEALNTHLVETNGHVEKLEKIFELIDKKPFAKKCNAMEGLIEECEELMVDMEEGAQRDAAIIFATQKMEHYEIATYGTLATFSKTMGYDKVTVLLKEILSEEKNIDHILTHIAVASINEDALREEEQESAE